MENHRGSVLSIEAVKMELEDPHMKQWASENKIFFAPNDVSRLPEVSTWVEQQARYPVASQNTFLAGADPLVIAFALRNNHIIVTHEKPEPKSAKVKIPDVCDALGIEYQNTFAVLETLKARFVLEITP